MKMAGQNVASKKKDTPKSKSVFNKKSEAGKGDKPRIGISPQEWGEKWEKIFKPKVSGSKK
jgi:hypothetical protein